LEESSVANSRKSKHPIPGKPEGKGKKKHSRMATASRASAIPAHNVVAVDAHIMTGKSTVASMTVNSPLMAGTSTFAPSFAPSAPQTMTLTNVNGSNDAFLASGFDSFVTSDIDTPITLAHPTYVVQPPGIDSSIYANPPGFNAFHTHASSGTTSFNSSLFSPAAADGRTFINPYQVPQHPLFPSSAPTPSVEAQVYLGQRNSIWTILALSPTGQPY
jgi:hypothetical protein